MFGGTGEAAEEVVVVVVVASRMGELSLRQSHPLDRRESRRCGVCPKVCGGGHRRRRWGSGRGFDGR